MTSILHQIYRLLVLIALQAFLFSRLIVLRYGVSFVYIFFVLFMPLQWPKWVQYILAFLSGLAVDILSGTYGLHAISATIIVALRDVVIRLILPSYNEEEWESINIFNRDIGEYIIYSFVLSFVYCLVFFSLDFFSTSALTKWGSHILISTLFTFVSLLIYRYIFAISKDKSE